MVSVKHIGMVAGPLLGLLAWWLLPDFAPAGPATLGVMIWMAVWWLTEAIPIPATSLLPIAVFPLFGIANINDAAAPFANKLIFLFMGGFLLALAMQKWGLDRRIALNVLRLVGTKSVNMVGGFMIATAVLSGFVSNTATAAMMLPIALSVLALVESRGVSDDNFARCLLLGIAYAASLGGMATLIGIGVLEWMQFAVPLVVVFLVICWFLLTRVLAPPQQEEVPGGRAFVDEQLHQLGRMEAGEWVALVVFVFTAAAWVARPWLQKIPGLGGLSDTGIVICAALVLFLVPAKLDGRSTRVLDWETARHLPWGILLLFGGGLSLAAAVKANGVAEFIGGQATVLAGTPDWLIVLAITALVIFLTELTSNTATTATLLRDRVRFGAFDHSRNVSRRFVAELDRRGVDPAIGDVLAGSVFGVTERVVTPNLFGVCRGGIHSAREHHSFGNEYSTGFVFIIQELIRAPTVPEGHKNVASGAARESSETTGSEM